MSCDPSATMFDAPGAWSDMDRREALTKLAAGGTIAATGSLVLSSNNVAFASSVGDITGLPEPGQTIPVTYSAITANPARVQVAVDPNDPGFPHVTCPAGVVTPTYQWRLASYNTSATFPQYTQVYLNNVNDSATVIAGPATSVTPSSGRAACPTMGCPTSWSASSTTNGGFTLRKRSTGTLFPGTPFEFPFSVDTSLQNGDQWAVDLRITWQCVGSAVNAIYRYSGTFPNSPAATEIQAPAPA